MSAENGGLETMRILLPTLTMCLLTLPVSAKYSGGTGEPNDPYKIAITKDLIALDNEPMLNGGRMNMGAYGGIAR